MESAIDRLRQVVTLTKVWVPPHVRLMDGKTVYVDGYWRDAPDGAYVDLMGNEHLPSSSASALPESPDWEEIPLFEEPKPEAPSFVSLPTTDYVEVIPKVFMKDKRSQGPNTPPVSVDPASLQRQIDIVGIDMSQVDEIKIRLTDQSPSGGDQGVTQQVKPGTYVLGIAVAHKPEFKEHHMYVTNNSMIHELRHITQHQHNPNMSAEYAGFNHSVGYAYNPYEFDARLYGHIADPHQRKAIPAGTEYVDPEESFALRTDTGENGKGIPTPPEKVEKILAGPVQSPVKTGVKLEDMPTGEAAYAAANPGHSAPAPPSSKPKKSSSADDLMAIVAQMMGGGGTSSSAPKSKPKDLDGFPGEARIHDAITRAAKTVNFHSEDGEYNEETIQRLAEMRQEIVGLLGDLKNSDQTEYFFEDLTFNFGPEHHPDTEAAKSKYTAMLNFYLAQINTVMEARMLKQKTYAGLPEGASKILPRFDPESDFADLGEPAKYSITFPDGSVMSLSEWLEENPPGTWNYEDLPDGVLKAMRDKLVDDLGYFGPLPTTREGTIMALQMGQPDLAAEYEDQVGIPSGQATEFNVDLPKPRRVQVHMKTQETEHDGDIRRYLDEPLDEGGLSVSQIAAKHGVTVKSYGALPDEYDSSGDALRYEEGEIVAEAPSAEAAKAFQAELRGADFGGLVFVDDMSYLDPPNKVTSRVIQPQTHGVLASDKWTESERREVFADGVKVGEIYHAKYISGSPWSAEGPKHVDEWRIDTGTSPRPNYTGFTSFPTRAEAAKALAASGKP